MVNLWTPEYYAAIKEAKQVTDLIHSGHSLEKILEITGIDVKKGIEEQQKRLVEYLKGLKKFEERSRNARIIVKYQIPTRSYQAA